MLEPQQVQNFNNTNSRGIAESLVSLFKKRRSTRQFAPVKIDRELIINAIEVAMTAPSGANKQPWSFGLIEDLKSKRLIRDWAEKEESEFYHVRAPKRWLKDLDPLHTHEVKAYLTDASYLIPIFSKSFEVEKEGGRASNYYVKESVGIATGFLIAALHLSGLSVLTYTPSQRNNLTELLKRPKNEKTFMVLAVGLPADNAKVPVISKNTLSDVLTIYENVDERNQLKNITLPNGG